MLISELKIHPRILDYQVDITIRLTKYKHGFAVGTYSLCGDGKHVIYLDYDNFRFEWLLQEIKELIEKHKLSNFYVLRSSVAGKGKYKHHAVCFDKVSARHYHEIVNESNADIHFRNNGFFDLENARVLRCSGKSNSCIDAPKFYAVISSQYALKQKSMAHILFYKNMFAIPDTYIDYARADDSTAVNILSYATKNI
jgi:hypothetical protein